MKRLIEQTACPECETFHLAEHITYNEHGQPKSCPGGSSREVTVDLSAATRKHRELCTKDGWPTENGIQEIIDAALGGGW